VSLFLKMLVEELPQCNFHVIHQFLHPTLYFSLNLDRLNLYLLIIIRNQFNNLKVFLTSFSMCLNVKAVDSFKYFTNVLKNWVWILWLTNYFQKIFVWQEIETWELTSLCF
jgi:hypothetical protein